MPLDGECRSGPCLLGAWRIAARLSAQAFAAWWFEVLLANRTVVARRQSCAPLSASHPTLLARIPNPARIPNREVLGAVTEVRLHSR